jgi:hypothetical protein
VGGLRLFFTTGNCLPAPDFTVPCLIIFASNDKPQE